MQATSSETSLPVRNEQENGEQRNGFAGNWLA